MTAKAEIRDLFTAELMNTLEYEEVTKMRTYIIDEIVQPNVQEQVVYTFSSEQSLEQQKIIKLCMLMEFGFYVDTINSECVIIDMKKFLE